MSARKNALNQKMNAKTRSTLSATLDARSGMKPGAAPPTTAAARRSETRTITAQPRASDLQVAQRVDAHEREEEEERPRPSRPHDLERARRRVGRVEAHAGQEEAAEARLLRRAGHPAALRAIEGEAQGSGRVGDPVQVAAHAAVAGEDHERRLVRELARLRVVAVLEPHCSCELVDVALPALHEAPRARDPIAIPGLMGERLLVAASLRERLDRKSTRLNSSHEWM